MKTDLRFRFSWNNWVVSSLLFVVSVACTPEKKKQPAPPVEKDERELLEPVEQMEKYSSRCKAVPGTQPVTLRASSGDGDSGAVEAGGAVAFDGGFVVGILRTAVETTAEIVYLDGRGGSKVTKLGRVHGSVEPPQVVLVGDDAIAAVVDNDAGHTRLRLVKVAHVAKEAQITWGPEVVVRRGETQGFSLSRGQHPQEKSGVSVLLAWDDFDRSNLRSAVRGLLLDAQSMQPVGPEFQISPQNEDATTPLVLSANGDSAGFLSVWLAYEEQAAPKEQNPSLVYEPPMVLHVQRLDSAGKPQGDPLRVSRPGSNVLVYDARMQSGGELAVAYREAETGREEGASPVKVDIVGTDGTVKAQTAGHDELGPGAPALLEAEQAGAVWLSARGRESDVLLGLLASSGQVQDFGLEFDLRERIPLASRGGLFLVMEPDGLDLRFSTLRCAP